MAPLVLLQHGGSATAERVPAPPLASSRFWFPPSHVKVAIVGRPNVGKSALFNRLVGRRQALVLDTPSGHVTRDWKEGRAALGDLRFTVVDTSGLEPERAARDPASIQARGAALTASVLARADATVFLVDARQGRGPGREGLKREGGRAWGVGDGARRSDGIGEVPLLTGRGRASSSVRLSGVRDERGARSDPPLPLSPPPPPSQKQRLPFQDRRDAR